MNILIVVVVVQPILMTWIHRNLATAFTRHVTVGNKLDCTRYYHRRHRQQISNAFFSSSSSSSLRVKNKGILNVDGELERNPPPSPLLSPHDYDLDRPYFPIYYNDVYEVDLPPGHRFPMGKYRKVREMVQKKVSEFSAQERELVQSGRIPRITPCHNDRPRWNALPQLHRSISQR